MSPAQEQSRKELGAFIRARRKAVGMTAVELAGKLGLQHQAVTSWERGKSVPRTEMLTQLAALLGCEVADLAGLAAA